MSGAGRFLEDKTKTMKVVDLFCGCGGMSLGFQNSGFEVLAGFDNWGPAVEVYDTNFDHPVHKVDLGEDSVIQMINELHPDLIIGGPPCQDFSSAGSNNFLQKRAYLVSSFAKIVANIRPSFFVLENVPRARNSQVFKNAETDLKNAGYGLTKIVLDASYCGVPQSRKRFFAIGHLGAEDGFLDGILQKNQSDKQLSLREYFGADLPMDYYFRIPTNYTRKAVFSVDEPSVTIRGVERPIPKTYRMHPNDLAAVGDNVRTFTILERSYIQTFPKSFNFFGSKTDLNTMIGNAVPVKLAEFVARAIAEFCAQK